MIRFTLFSKNPPFREGGLLGVPQLVTFPREGGGDGTRTHDRLVANQVLYQLSYAPSDCWWA